MFKIFKKKEVVKMYRVIRGYNIWTEEWEEINTIVDMKGLSNMAMNGLENLEIERIK